MVLSYVAPYIRHIIVIGLAAVLFAILSREPPSAKEVHHNDGQATNFEERFFTDQELAEYDGREGSKGLYLVILGYVYDVQKGAKHYGPGEAYNMFVGHDASKSFISGDFEEYSPELSDVSSLTDSELKSIVKWKSFYDENYVYKGKLIGRYFDERGELTEYHKVVLRRVARAEAEEAAKPKQEFPSCNVEWKQETGTKVWCSSRSGDGVERGWVGKPRRYLKREDKSPHCVCVPDGTETDALVPFENCDASSESCYVKDE